MNNPLFKMAGGPNGNHYLGTMHGSGIGVQALNQGIGGNSIGQPNLPPRSQQNGSIYSASTNLSSKQVTTTQSH
jgi:hypothetical protein